MSFLRARSPVTPKSTNEDGPAIRFKRRSRGSRSGLMPGPHTRINVSNETSIVFHTSRQAVRPSTAHESICSRVSPEGTVSLSASVYRPGSWRVTRMPATPLGHRYLPEHGLCIVEQLVKLLGCGN